MILRSGAVALTLCLAGVLAAQHETGAAIDSDHDGLPDNVEARLSEAFRPTFLISSADCSVRPASFLANQISPIVTADDGSIYGQVFVQPSARNHVEVHYYHLWRKDCGELGHRLDAEHVSVLLTGGSLQTGDGWTAAYWYAASHEDTLCDASQVARASTLNAEKHGPQVWISSGKHASFLSESLCHTGCGGDRCELMQELPARAVINLGEWSTPMNGAVWLRSSQWPLAGKMVRSDFTQERLARVERLPLTDVAWANPERRPAQAAILGANAGLGGAAIGAQAAGSALQRANESTGHALDVSTRKTGRALSRAYHAATHTVGGGKRESAPADASKAGKP